MKAERHIAPAHRLQDLVLVADEDCRALYWHQVDRAGAAIAADDGGTIRPHCRQRFDTLVNCVFERYWRDLTTIRTLAFVAVTSGPCRIRIVRRVVGQPETILADVAADGAYRRSSLAICLDDLAAADALLFAEVEALDEPATLHEGAWQTACPAPNEVRLAIVVCSFGREAMLVENLRRIAPAVARTAAIGALLVVRQGGVELDAYAPYRALVEDAPCGAKLRLIRQDNFGGTGGFVRGILESLDADATHVLLLDDDVRIEPAVIERLAALTRYLSRPTTIGGQMLDLSRPTMLHASHERVALRSLDLENPCRDTDMGAPGAVDLFGHRHVSHYNAWWFCCIPASTITTSGLPAPMFIRHDDIEYGVRTIADGTPLVTMPGLFVWHEPFTNKNISAASVYYERRNFLIAAAMHRQVSPLRLVARHWYDAWIGLRRRRYDYCWAICRAVEDYLKGPEAVFADIRTLHRDLARDQARFTLLTMAHLRRRMARPRRADSRADASFTSTTRHLFREILRTGIALLWRSRRAGARYRAQQAAFTSQPFWRALLALPPGPGLPS